jgi:hypothetical protein
MVRLRAGHCGQCLQYRSRSGRHGGRDADDHWRPCLFLDPIFRFSNPGTPPLDFIPDDGARLQVADDGSIRLRRSGFLVPSQLERGASRDIHPARRMEQGLHLGPGGNLGYHHLTYLFFWQAAQEVEEDRDHGKNTVVKRKGATNKELRVAKRDVITGMLLSNLVMSFSFSQPGRHSTLMDNNTSKLQSKLLRLSVLLQAQEPIGCSRLESSGPECWQFQYWPDLAHTRSRKEPNGKTPHLTSSRNLRPTFMP